MYNQENFLSLESLISKSKEKLVNANIINAQKEIDWFLQYQFSISLYNRKRNKKYQINNLQKQEFHDFIQRRIAGEPFQYIINQAPFYGYDFIVNKYTLIPRPETETIITIAKQYNQFDTGLDIGTGSGNLAITLSLENQVKTVDAIEISKEALEIAKENKKRHNTLNVNLLKQNIFENKFNKSYDLIVSNPPYVSTEEYTNLHKEVKNYEPKIALTDNNDGLDFYRFFSKKLIDILNPQGKIILEIGYEKMREKVQDLFSKNNCKYKWHKDLNGDIRVIEIYK